jgi:CheY-like chemotaxis protein
MRKIFIFEDDKNRIDQFKKYLCNDDLYITDNIKTAKMLLMKHDFDTVLLDHDMDQRSMVESTEDNTGFQVASFIVQENLPLHQVIVHSHNPIGAENMMNILERFGTKIEQVHQVPFYSLIAILKMQYKY